ncbi:MAG TPA: hypothetical protein VH988_18330 [Thermoanaerobaculia bacterium]|jgi:hypothetical protein|nr:hypothetical protein [Thermoanaerobaculia bacterium]
MAYDPDWNRKTWVVQSSKVTDLNAGDVLTFTGTGAGDGALRRKDKSGADLPDWGSGCCYSPGDQVGVTKGSDQYTITRDPSTHPATLSCYPGPHRHSIETAASWTAQEGGGGGITHRRRDPEGDD